MPFDFDMEVEEKVVFDERLFNDNKTYSKDLARLSFAFAVSSFSSNRARSDLSKSADNGIEFLSQCGFRKIRPTIDYSLPPTPYSLGAIFGKRKIKIGKRKLTLIAIGVRGGNYGAEWASNVTLGKKGPHEGFALSKEKLYQDFISYLLDYRIKGKIAIWVTGFSRAGGVANLFAGDILDESKEERLTIHKASIDRDSVYAYCFASPSTGEKENQGYQGIFHTLNPNDAVPLIPPKEFGFSHYGEVIYLPDFYDEDINIKAREILDRLGVGVPKKEFYMMKFDLLHMKDKERRCVVDAKAILVKQSEFLTRVRLALTSGMDREGYYENVQDGLASLLGLVDSSLENPYIHIKNVLSSLFSSMFEEHNGISLLSKLLSKKFDMASFLAPYAEKALEEEKLDNIDKDKIALSLTYLAKASLPYLQKNTDLVATMIGGDNSSLILLAHTPALYWALLNQI